MIPAGVIAEIGLTAAQIAETAGVGLPLANLYDVAGGAAGGRSTFFTFINAWNKNAPLDIGLSATEAYRAAKFWSDQSGALQLIDESMPIDRRLARVVGVTQDKWEEGAQYKYLVEVNVTFPGESKSSTFGVWVPSNQLLTPEGAIAQGEDLLFARWDSTSIPADQGGELEGVTVRSNVTGFIRYQLKD